MSSSDKIRITRVLLIESLLYTENKFTLVNDGNALQGTIQLRLPSTCQFRPVDEGRQKIKFIFMFIFIGTIKGSILCKLYGLHYIVLELNLSFVFYLH